MKKTFQLDLVCLNRIGIKINKEISKLDYEPDYKKIALNLINSYLEEPKNSDDDYNNNEIWYPSIEKSDEVNKPVQKLAKNNKVGPNKAEKI
ncbi:29669_t:CDS:2 [Gigaspora margarita]|uniref:29669_t:CDS:1 n=1 Tax=Gigaspora margarita TaxID=4874 RepID=A0ABN7VQT4_GIGMA|nr:29669_t:CDS:2 [Gigaspora margarita]